jgi:hypothetical protein
MASRASDSEFEVGDERACAQAYLIKPGAARGMNVTWNKSDGIWLWYVD